MIDTASKNIMETEKVSQTNKDYSDLKKIIVAEKLLEKQTGFQIRKIVLTMGLLACSVAILLTVKNPWLQMLNAVFMAFASAQVSFLGHDAGHRQIATTARGNDILGYFVGNLLSGASFSWWLHSHNSHHSHTNDLDHDPDMVHPLFVYAPEQAAGKKGLGRFVSRHQKYLFLPLMSLSAIGLKAGGLIFLFKEKPKTRWMELALISVYLVSYLTLTIGTLGLWALPFIVIHQGFLGLFLGTVFAPNHKAMPLSEKSRRPDFLRSQVLTSRNVYSHPFTDFWYGGLNYQIEHHLFPSIPRNRMKELQKVVRAFCEERKVEYYETGTVQSYREILNHMHEVSAPLREKPSNDKD